MGFGWVVDKVVDEVVGCDLRVVDIGYGVCVGMHAQWCGVDDDWGELGYCVGVQFVVSDEAEGYVELVEYVLHSL